VWFGGPVGYIWYLVGGVGQRRCGWWDKRLRANKVPALWETREMCGMERWVSKAGMVSRKIGMRCETGTGVEAPKPGLVTVS
jgi:hypothetical protein